MVGYGHLKNLLLTNVAEIKFARRLPVVDVNKGPTRRMWCTNCLALLNSFNGKNVLRYRIPKYLPKFNPNEKNVIVTWDILMQDFRCINMDSCELMQSMPANDDFWTYFNENLLLMTTQQKINFMKS